MSFFDCFTQKYAMFSSRTITTLSHEHWAVALFSLVFRPTF